MTGQDRELFRRNGLGELFASPDGRFAAAAASSGQAGADGFDSVLIVPTTGGEPREVFRPGSGKTVRVLAWTPSADALLVRVSQPSMPAGAGQVWWIPIGTSQPHSIGRPGEDIVGASLSPDARRIAYTLKRPPTEAELWVLENFLPGSSTR